VALLSELVLPVASAVSVKVHSRVHVVGWYGSCSFRKLKVTIEFHHMLCPHDGLELRDAEYVGSKVFCMNRRSRDYVKDSWESLLESGVRVWNIVPKSVRKPYVFKDKPEESYD
jgi:hypothetical protein